MPILEFPNTPVADVLTSFKNEKFLDFSVPENRVKMLEALSKVKGELGREFDLVVGNRRLRTMAKIVSVNPAKPAEVIGIHQRAETEHVEVAMEVALAAFQSWKHVAGVESFQVEVVSVPLTDNFQHGLNLAERMEEYHDAETT